ncbi:hypothetical protein MTO96_042614 [Rhipicephalus appendiculatus]
MFQNPLGFRGGNRVSGVGVGRSAALLQGGPAFAKAVALPAFLMRTVHQNNKMNGGGASSVHSGLGGAYGGCLAIGRAGHKPELGGYGEYGYEFRGYGNGGEGKC